MGRGVAFAMARGSPSRTVHNFPWRCTDLEDHPSTSCLSSGSEFRCLAGVPASRICRIDSMSTRNLATTMKKTPSSWSSGATLLPAPERLCHAPHVLHLVMCHAAHLCQRDGAPLQKLQGVVVLHLLTSLKRRVWDPQELQREDLSLLLQSLEHLVHIHRDPIHTGDAVSGTDPLQHLRLTVAPRDLGDRRVVVIHRALPHLCNLQ